MAKGKKTGGRVAGTPNKATREIKELAQSHAPAAIARLAFLAEKAESEAASVAACNSLLDRAYGKAPQAVQVNPDDDGQSQPVKIEFGWAASKGS